MASGPYPCGGRRMLQALSFSDGPPGAAHRVASAAAGGPDAVRDAVVRAVGGLGGQRAALVLVFPDSESPWPAVAAQAAAAAPGARLAGMTSEGLLTGADGGRGCVALAVAGGFQIGAGIAEHASADMRGAGRRATEAALRDVSPSRVAPCCCSSSTRSRATRRTPSTAPTPSPARASPWPGAGRTGRTPPSSSTARPAATRSSPSPSARRRRSSSPARTAAGRWASRRSPPARGAAPCSSSTAGRRRRSTCRRSAGRAPRSTTRRSRPWRSCTRSRSRSWAAGCACAT